MLALAFGHRVPLQVGSRSDQCIFELGDHRAGFFPFRVPGNLLLSTLLDLTHQFGQPRVTLGQLAFQLRTCGKPIVGLLAKAISLSIPLPPIVVQRILAGWRAARTTDPAKPPRSSRRCCSSACCVDKSRIALICCCKSASSCCLSTLPLLSLRARPVLFFGDLLCQSFQDGVRYPCLVARRGCRTRP